MVLITSFIESNGTLRVTFPEGSGCKDFAVPLKPEEENLKEWTMYVCAEFFFCVS